jgi:hypothetical protein
MATYGARLVDLLYWDDLYVCSDVNDEAYLVVKIWFLKV